MAASVYGREPIVATNPVVANQPRVVAAPTVAEPITIFHYEVLAVADHKVAKITTQMLRVSFALIVVAVVNFVWDLGRSSTTMTAAVWNLLTALSLPACGIIGVRDKNVTCIQYFCCCNYFCAFMTFISLIGVIMVLASSSDDTSWFIVQLLLYIFFFVVYCRGGGLSQQLQEQPYFTQERTNPRQPYNIHQNTVECNPQPVAQAAFVDAPAATLAPALPVAASAEVVATGQGSGGGGGGGFTQGTVVKVDEGDLEMGPMPVAQAVAVTPHQPSAAVSPSSSSALDRTL